MVELQKQSFSNQNLESPIKKATEAGLKLHQWLAHLNRSRPNKPIKLTSASTRLGFPIEKTKTYSPKLIEQRLEALLSEFPEAMTKVIFSSTKTSSQLPEGLDEKTFISEAYKLDRIYQSAVRWQTVMLPYKSYYSSRLWQDESYLRFKKIDDLEKKLVDFSELEKALQNRLNENLIGICLNNRKSRKYCSKVIASDNSRLEIYRRFIGKAEDNWQSFLNCKTQEEMLFGIEQTK